jgi:hypothetical protein
MTSPLAPALYGTLEHPQAMANHPSPRTINLYERHADEVSLDEYEKVGI